MSILLGLFAAAMLFSCALHTRAWCRRRRALRAMRTAMADSAALLAKGSR